MAQARAQAQERDIQRKLGGLLKLYDDGDYERGLKQLRPLVRSYPDHAELKAVRALFLRGEKQKEESSKLMAEALRADMQNPRIWKYQGILHKLNADYTKAAQCLTRSWVIDKTDLTLLQDLCNLLLFEHQYARLLEFSQQLLKVTTNATAVIRYVVALELNGRVPAALAFLTTYEKNMLPSENEEELVFRSELGIHHANLLLKLGQYQECVEYIKGNPRIRDPVQKLEISAKAYAALDARDDVIGAARELLKHYPENGEYFRILEENLTAEEYLQELFSIKQAQKSRYAEVRILELLPLDDPRFVDLAKEYLVPYLVKGSPTIFVCLAELSLEKLDVCAEIARAAEVPITSVPIVHNFLADVYVAHGNYTAALAEVDAGIDHTPTVLELMHNKIRILRKLGRISEGAAVAADLIVYDPADRHTNTVHMNALILNGQLKTAIDAALPFSMDHKRHPKLFQTQYTRLYLRCADCAVRAGDRGTGIRFYQAAVQTFEEFRKSQFNYLGWGMKKIPSLMKMIKWSDELIKDRVLARAGFCLLRLFLAAGELQAAEELALKFVRAADPTVLALSAVTFARLGTPLPALKCFRKLGNAPARFAAAPAVSSVMAALDSAPELVRQVALELYVPLEGVPESAPELVMAARGALYVGDRGRATQLLITAAKRPGLSFKTALEIFGAAVFEVADEALAAEIEGLIKTENPAYELRPLGAYEVPDLTGLHGEDELNCAINN